MKRLVFLILISLLTTGCSIQKFAIRSMDDFFDAGFSALLAEDDLGLAQTSIESNLMLLVSMLEIDPDNDEIKLLLAEGFTSYALAFVEDDDPARATALYLRARDYGNEWLMDEAGIDLLSITRNDEFETAISYLPESAIPGAFWMANAWAQASLLSLHDVSAIAALPKIEALMRFVLETDETYYHAGPHLFFGSYYGARPPMLGGNPELAREHFNRHRELTGDTFLLGHYLMVKYLAITTYDEELAGELFELINSYNLDDAPEIRLINRIAKAKARRLQTELEDYF